MLHAVRSDANGDDDGQITLTLPDIKRPSLFRAVFFSTKLDAGAKLCSKTGANHNGDGAFSEA